MSSKSLDLTTTPCAKCGKTSTENEEMIACDNCDLWYHTRCVGLTVVPKKDKKWFCPVATCQAVLQEYQKQKKALSQKKKADPPTVTLSVTPSIPSSVEEKLKQMEAERKRLEAEMDAECLLREKEIEMKNALKERRMRMNRGTAGKGRASQPDEEDGSRVPREDVQDRETVG